MTDVTIGVSGNTGMTRESHGSLLTAMTLAMDDGTDADRDTIARITIGMAITTVIQPGIVIELVYKIGTIATDIRSGITVITQVADMVDGADFVLIYPSGVCFSASELNFSVA